MNLYTENPKHSKILELVNKLIKFAGYGSNKKYMLCFYTLAMD